jgi:ADP-heptose:LPS heptosyltransferase
MKLAIFKVNQLGDNLVFLPVVQSLRRSFPDWKLFLFTSPVAAELFDDDVPRAEMLVLPTRDFNRAWKTPRTLLKLVSRSWRECFDASLLGHDQGNVAHLLARLAGGKVRAGVHPEFIKVPGSLTRTVTFDPGLPMAQVSWELARALVEQVGGGTPWAPAPPAPILDHLAGGAVPIAGRVVIHCGASLAYQRWFPERYVALANRLSERFEVIWIDQPHTTAADLSARVRRVAPRSLSEFITTLRTASLLVANNSGPMHIASALGCPSIIISGPSNPVWDPFWYPERFMVLRDTSLYCLPCDRSIRPAGSCQNAETPLACLNYWSVEEVERRCDEWMARWSVLAAGQTVQNDR